MELGLEEENQEKERQWQSIDKEKGTDRGRRRRRRRRRRRETKKDRSIFAVTTYKSIWYLRAESMVRPVIRIRFHP